MESSLRGTTTALMLKSGLHLKPQPGDHRVRATIEFSLWALEVASHASWEGIFHDGDFLNGTGDHLVRATIESRLWALEVASHASWEGVFPDGDFLNGTPKAKGVPIGIKNCLMLRRYSEKEVTGYLICERNVV